jgi:RecB family exonuclease
MNTSFSALDTFKTCPLKYKYQQIDKIRTPKGPEAVFGTLVHSTMKFIHDGNFLLPTQKQALEFFSKNWNPEVFEDEIQERSAFAQGIKIVQDYYKKNDANKTQIVDLESRFTIEIKDEEKKDESHLVSGFIDRIDKTEDGFEIIDYKTSRKLPAQKMIDENLQLLIYLLAFLKRYPDLEKTPDKVKLSLYFLKHGTKLSSTKNESQIDEGRQAILDIIKEIEKSDFGPRVSPLCDWCGYQENCPMWKHKFKKNQESGIKNQEEKEKIIKEYIDLQDGMKSGRKKIAELAKQILEIMEEEKVERLFSKDKIVAKTSRKTYKYNEEEIKNVLQSAGLWDRVLKIDGVKLKKVLALLPANLKKEVEKNKEVDRESHGLSIKKA